MRGQGPGISRGEAAGSAPSRRPPALLLALLAVVVGGCLPSSQRENDRAISAADSASVALAETVPTDTLALVWTATAPDADPMPVPTSLGWAGDALAVVETQDGSVRRFSASGAYLDRTQLPAGSFPYLSGTRGDTVVVFERGAGRLAWVVPGRGVARSVPTPDGATAALAAPGVLAARVGGGPDTTSAALVRLGETGAVRSRHPIPGPAWRAVGFVRLWDGRIAALSGYRPVVDLVPTGAASAPADTLALVGFSSPQLVRSAQFARGEVDEPPLLSSSAAAFGGRLFVLNLRSDHVRIDVFGADGRLERVLVSPDRGLESVVALDVAAREGPGGAVDLAVLRARQPGLTSRPESRVELYRWAGDR